jgi:hypothetical protein
MYYWFRPSYSQSYNLLIMSFAMIMQTKPRYRGL